MASFEAILIFRPEKLEGSDFDNIHIKVTCASFSELSAIAEDFMTGYNNSPVNGAKIFDWYIANDEDVLASMMLREEE